MRTTGPAAAVLAAIGVLHVSWAAGAGRLRGRGSGLADAVAGTELDRAPGPVACLAVAGLLGTAATLVAGHPRRRPALRRTGAAGVVAVLAVRGALGVAGRTDLLVPMATSARFRRLDRRLYGPLCLALAAASGPAAGA